MPLAFTAPQRQLKSVALRYRHALAGPGGRARPAAQPLQAVSAETPAAPAPRVSEFFRHEKLARLEAALFIAGEPLNARKIAQAASLADATEARTLIGQLNVFYDTQASAFRVEQVAGGYQILTRAQFGGWLRRLRQAPVETRLSAPAAETLAVVAYRQPVQRAEIESIRGVQCGEILRQLMDRNLVRIVGRSPELGRPFLYGTTRRFLQWSGLRSLDELPRSETLAHDTMSAARRHDELNPRNDLNEESEVKIVASPESVLNEPWTVGVANLNALPLGAWPLAAPAAHADEGEDFKDEDDDFDDDEDEDDDYDDEDDDLDEDEDDEDEDEDLEDEEWEEVDDDDDWDDDEEDEDWDDDEEDEDDDDDDWDDE